MKKPAPKPEKEAEHSRVGRPYKLEPDDKTINTLSSLGKIQCTNNEAAAVLGVSRETFEQFLGRHEKARDAWLNGKQTGTASLRRQQFAMSEKNAAMAIWLGKQYLGQKDRQELSGDENSPVRVAGRIEFVVVDPEPTG